MKSRSFLSSALAAAALSMGLASTALAGDAVRLVVEVPSESAEVEPGAQVPVQVVGEDAQGARVGFGGREVVLRATAGTMEVVKSPYNFRFTAPQVIEGRTKVIFRAHLRGAPGVRGEGSLTVIPQGPYNALVLRPDRTGNLPFGQSMLIEVLGKRGGGQVLVTDQRIKMAIRGPAGAATSLGKVEFVTQGRFRYTAPPVGSGLKRGATVRLEAWLERYPAIKGSHSVILGRSGKPRPGTAVGGGTARPPAPPPPVKEPVNEPVKPPVKEPVKDPKPEPAATGPQKDGVLWPSGNVRVATWRARSAKDAEFGKNTRRLPVAGGDFVAPQDVQKIRVVLLRKDVKKAEMVWYVGNKNGATVHRLAPTKAGPFRATYNKSNQRVYHIEVTLPAERGKSVHVELLLHTTDRQKIRENFRFRRGKDRDRDGRRDKK